MKYTFFFVSRNNYKNIAWDFSKINYRIDFYVCYSVRGFSIESFSYFFFIFRVLQQCSKLCELCIMCNMYISSVIFLSFCRGKVILQQFVWKFWFPLNQKLNFIWNRIPIWVTNRKHARKSKYIFYSIFLLLSTNYFKCSKVLNFILFCFWSELKPELLEIDICFIVMQKWKSDKWIVQSIYDEIETVADVPENIELPSS